MNRVSQITCVFLKQLVDRKLYKMQYKMSKNKSIKVVCFGDKERCQKQTFIFLINKLLNRNFIYALEGLS